MYFYCSNFPFSSFLLSSPGHAIHRSSKSINVKASGRDIKGRNVSTMWRIAIHVLWIFSPNKIKVGPAKSGADRKKRGDFADRLGNGKDRSCGSLYVCPCLSCWNTRKGRSAAGATNSGIPSFLLLDATTLTSAAAGQSLALFFLLSVPGSFRVKLSIRQPDHRASSWPSFLPSSLWLD